VISATRRDLNEHKATYNFIDTDVVVKNKRSHTL